MEILYPRMAINQYSHRHKSAVPELITYEMFSVVLELKVRTVSHIRPVLQHYTLSKLFGEYTRPLGQHYACRIVIVT